MANSGRGGRGGRGHRGGRGGAGGRRQEHIAPSVTSDQAPLMETRNDSSSIIEQQAVTAPSQTMNMPSASIGTTSNEENTSNGSNVRGVTCGQGARKAMKSSKARLAVEFDFSLKQAICDNTEAFNNEIGYNVRMNCSFQYKEWRLVPESVRAPLRHKLLTLFDIDVENDEVKEVIDKQMAKAWKGQKYKFHSHFKKNGGEEDRIKAKSIRHDQCSQVDWDYLCDYWTTPKYLKRQEQNVESRLKRKFDTRNGSKSTARHHLTRGAELDAPTGHIETWRLRHWHHLKGWISSVAEAKYKEMKEYRSKNPPEKMSDKEILEKVIGRESVRLFGWGRSPSSSSSKRNTGDSGRPTYNQLINELNQYKTRFEDLEGHVHSMRQMLVEKNIVPPMPSDNSSRPSHTSASPIDPSAAQQSDRTHNTNQGFDDFGLESDDDLC